MLPIHIDEIPMEIREYLNKIISISFPRQGYTSNVGIIKSDQGIFVLKRTKGKLFSSMLKKEVSILDCLNQKTGLPIPKVKKFIEHNNMESWALIDYLEGETIRMALLNEDNYQRRQEIIFNFGKILSEIHLTPCPDELLINEQSWLNRVLDEAEYNLNNNEVDGTEELLKRLKIKKPKDYKQTLIHGDFTIDNVMISNGVITGVIDWSSGAYGDPRYDVSLAIRPKPNAFVNEIDEQIFFEGYGGRIIDNDEYDYFTKGLYEFF